MKLIYYKLGSSTVNFIYSDISEVKNTISNLFKHGYNRILAKHNNKMYIIERMHNYILDSDYTKTEIKHHPYMNLLDD